MLAVVACEDTPSTPSPTSTPRPIPSPVVIRDEPQDVGLEDPFFEALPGARAYFGELGGTVFRIEMPNDWNRRLVLYMHGFQGLAPEAAVQTPGIREYLIAHGYAWGASSYSSTALIPGRAADETAALWDEFASRFGPPEYTYVTGHSMGGAATQIAAERYLDRFDGALGLCGFAGQTAITRIIGDYFYVGAFVAGVSQEEFDSSDVYALIETRIKPALRDPALHERWVEILTSMTGGRRALDHEGFALEEDTNWSRAPILVAFGLAYNEGRVYNLGGLSGVTDAAFNAGVVRRKPATPEQIANFNEGNELSGDLKIPLLTLHTTGDWQVPVDQQQMLRLAVNAAGKGDLLVQRIVRAPEHCGFTEREWTQALEDLVAWAEHDARPAGDDVLIADLRNVGTQFTLAPRFGTPEAAAVPGADRRLTISGTITLDGAPFNAFMWVEVVDAEGRRQVCNFPGAPVRRGEYERTLAADAELRGCGAPGRGIEIVAYDDGYLYATEALPWPKDASRLRFDAALSRGEPRHLSFFGTLHDAAGNPVAPGRSIQAYVGEALCGESSVPYAVMAFSSPDFYELPVVTGVEGCDAPSIEIRVDGEHVRDASMPHGSMRLDLTVKDP